jgi:hypothetical protein
MNRRVVHTPVKAKAISLCPMPARLQAFSPVYLYSRCPSLSAGVEIHEENSLSSITDLTHAAEPDD